MPRAQKPVLRERPRPLGAAIRANGRGALCRGPRDRARANRGCRRARGRACLFHGCADDCAHAYARVRARVRADGCGCGHRVRGDVRVRACVYEYADARACDLFPLQTSFIFLSRCFAVPAREPKLLGS